MNFKRDHENGVYVFTSNTSYIVVFLYTGVGYFGNITNSSAITNTLRYCSIGVGLGTSDYFSIG